MIKHIITASALIAAGETYAQALPAKDTIPPADSLVADLRVEARDNLPTFIVSEESPDEEGAAIVSSILTAGRDPFLSAAEFNFSPVRFRLRGYETRGNAVYINGIDFTGLDNGFIPFSLWGGLNSVVRARETTHGLGASDFSIGALALNTYVDMRAGAQRAQTQVGYALSNRNYSHRLMFQHGSSFNKNGWAYSVALTGRYATEGYIPGTYYRSGSYYAAVDKKMGGRHVFSLIAFGAPSENGRQGPSVQEAMDLARSHYYNPSWGYQNGKKRSANVLQAFQPVWMMTHEYKAGEKARLSASLAYTSGKRKNSGLDWYNAPDPRPDYYRYLPGYYRSTNPATYESLLTHYRQNPDNLQIQWNQLYEANNANVRTINNADGLAGNDITGKRSVYILSNRVNKVTRIMGNLVYNGRLTPALTVTAGANYQQQVNRYYQEVKDLLGGDFWVNINQFAERDFPAEPGAVQHNLDKPNQLVRQGELYGYHYTITTTRMAAWAQLLARLRSFDLFAAAELSATSFHRNGFNRNGLFPALSYGRSPQQHFNDPAVKAGVTYKMNGRNYFFANGTYRTMAPFFENAYISQRTRSTLQEGLKSEVIISGELGYKHSAPGFRFGITGFYSKFSGGVDILTFYHDQYQNFVNYALSGINKVFFGGEIGTEIKLNAAWSFNGAAAIGRYYFDSRQRAMVTVDNSAKTLARQTIYLKNYRLPSTPQNACSAGLFYRSPRYWYASVTGNYFSNMWLSPNPLRRTADAIADADPENPSADEVRQAILQQEKFDAGFTVDFFGGWSQLLPRRYYINNRRTYVLFNLGVNNLLNNKNIRSGGFEQLRFDFEGKDPDKFPPKYYYAMGLNFFASIGLRF